MTFRIFSGDTYILFQLFLAMTPPLARGYRDRFI